jgi:hypothetical protein
MSYENTQLTPATGYKTTNMVFEKIQVNSIPNSTMTYRRINIATRNPDNTVGELIFPTTRLFSYGVSENKDMATGNVNGHVLPLCLYNKNGPSDAEKSWVDTFNSVVEACREHLLDNKNALGLYDLDPADLRKFNPLYYKKDKGKVVEGTGPVLYPRLIASKKNNVSRILTLIYDENGIEIDPMSIIGKYCYTTACIKIESIFIGTKISLQVKVYEAEVRLIDKSIKRLLPPTKRMTPPDISTELPGAPPSPEVRPPSPTKTPEEGSIKDSESESEPEDKPRIIKRIVKKAKK